jgi:presenilin-like A22 family membrane protease
LTEKYNVNVIYLVPILVSLLFGLVCASAIFKTPTPILSVTPFPETNPGGSTNTSAPYLNAAYFVVLVAIGASVLYVLMKRKSHRTITYLTGFALTAAFLLVSIIYLSAIINTGPFAELTVVIISIVVTFLADFAVFKLGGVACTIVVLGLGGALGVFFGSAIPVYSAAIILAALAVYDVFAVYYGPVGKLATSGLDKLPGLSFSFKDIQMGLGDLVFYSLLTGNMLFNFGLVPCFVSLIGILAGSFLTFLMLERRGVFPGLPFPIILGLAGGLLTALLI